MTALNAQIGMDLERGSVGSSKFAFVRKLLKFLHISLLGLTLVFGACAKNSTALSQAEIKQSIQSKNFSEVTSDENLGHNSKVIGKPSETIETPDGDRDIYDPAQDIDVIAAFRRIFNRSKSTILDKSVNPSLLPDMDANLIFQAVDRRRIAFKNLGCEELYESMCGARIKFNPECSHQSQKSCFRIAATNSSGTCSIAEQKIFDRRYHPVGSEFYSFGYLDTHKNSSPPPGFKEQLQNYFFSKCRSW